MVRKVAWACIIALVSAAACSASSSNRDAGAGDGQGESGGESPGNGGAGAGSTSQGEGGLFGGEPGGDGDAGGCDGGPDDDEDMDGFTPAQGDCNDCDPNTNPAAVEVIAGDPSASALDEDCDGLIDEMDPDTLPCDADLPLDGGPEAGARAIEICKVAATADDWGLIKAKWVLADGTPPPAGKAGFDLGHGILSAFGPNVNVQRGARMLAVSSGTARQPTDPGYKSPSAFYKGYECNHPEGFPKESPSCGVAVTGDCFDSTALELEIRAPANAHGFSFDFNFYTFEWPQYVCSKFNDFFTTLLLPYPAGQTDGNITFDDLGNPISVNNTFVGVCGCDGGPPCTANGKTFDCSLGTAGLVGTGFGADSGLGDHASTSWLVTKAPIEPGSVFTLRFLAYDSGDGLLDSTGLVDNFQWIAEPGTDVGTAPLPDPK